MASPTTPTSGPRASSRPVSTGCASRSARMACAGRSRSRPSAGCRSTTRSPAAAAGRAAGLTLDEIETGLAGGWSAPHRVQVVRLGGVTVVDDTYNASPRSVVAALDLLAGLPGRRGAVLGEMLELGEASDEGHRVVGEAAARTVDWLVVVGAGARAIAEGAAAAGLAERDIVRVPDAETALDALVAAPARRRRRAGQGVPRDRPRARRRRSPARARRARAPMTVELIQGLLLAFALMVILMSPYIRRAPRAGLRQAHPPGGSGEPLHQGGNAHDGRPPDRRRGHRHLLLPAAGAGRVDLRPARGTGRRRAPWAPSTTTSTRGRARGSRSARSSSG